MKSKHRLSTFFRKLVFYVLRRTQPYIALFRAPYYTRYLAKYVENIGSNVKASGALELSYPRMLSLGSYVQLGKNCSLESEGGIIMGDRVVIGDEVVIETLLPVSSVQTPGNFHPDQARPIQIGSDVTIGNGVRLRAGSRVETGAVVPAGEVVNGYVRAEKRSRGSAVSKAHVCAKELGENMFFVVSTGRSGTTSIARVLSEHADIACKHEAKFPLNIISTQYAEEKLTREQVLSMLKGLYVDASNIRRPAKVYGESDLKSANLITELHELLPQARFIWLIRNAPDFVASSYGRGWFDAREYCYGDEVLFSPDTIVDESMFDKYRLEYSRYRINGGLCDPDLNQTSWQEMGAFERSCWYWNYWNLHIEEQLSHIPADQWTMVRLENLAPRLASLYSFLRVAPVAQTDRELVHNKAYHKVVKSDQWTPLQNAAYQKWCASSMAKWYPPEPTL